MRPQRIAAENRRIRRRTATAAPRASMRPQRIAAENIPLPRGKAGRRLASMRPQRIAAENICSAGSGSYTPLASMRPQRIAAENAAVRCGTNGNPTCFNEAAADCCGERIQGLPARRGSQCFNEAAADCCGEQPLRKSRISGLFWCGLRVLRVNSFQRLRIDSVCDNLCL